MSSEIVNRITQRQQIKDAIADLIAHKVDLRFTALEYYGVEGIGKTRMLEQAKKETLLQKLPLVVMDFRLGWSGEETPSQFITRFLGQICDQLDGRFPISAARAVLSDLPRNSQNIGGDFLQRYISLLIGSLDTFPLVLTLDSIEHCPAELFTWIGKEFISLYVQATSSSGVVVFLAGRGPRVLDSNWPRLFKRSTKSFRLEPLSFQHTEEHISALPPNGKYEKAAHFIYTLSNGHPYSTEVIIHELERLGVSVDQVTSQRQVLAEKLYDEVFRQHILGDASAWVRKFIEVASITRYFSPGLIQDLFRSLPELPVEINPDMEYQWFHYRLADLQDPPWQLIYIRQDVYEVEPTLRKLLHTALSILRPEETIRLHERAKMFHEKEIKAVNILEALYHTGVIVEIGQQKNVSQSVLRELDRLLTGFDLDKHLQELLLLIDLLKKDDELADLLDNQVVVALIQKVQAKINPQGTVYQSTHIVVEHFPPSEYRVGWYQADQVILPVEIVSSGLKFKPQRWIEQTLEAGKAAFSAYLPPRAQDFIRNRRDLAIQLSTNHYDVPWELLHDGKEFLCLSRPFARKAQTLSEPRRERPAKRAQRALVIGNPTEDLPGAEEEARAVADLLQNGGWEVKTMFRAAATSEELSLLVNSIEYGLIHFAGHGYFDKVRPQNSGLVFADGKLFANEFERWQKTPAFLFLSACESGQVVAEPTLRGEQMEGIAASALLGWVDAYLGPIWPIGDSVAREFALAFYRHLLGDDPFGEAVRQARLAVRDKSPDGWASWVFYGDPLKKLSDLTAK